jgi:hypothetical protein
MTHWGGGLLTYKLEGEDAVSSIWLQHGFLWPVLLCLLSS